MSAARHGVAAVVEQLMAEAGAIERQPLLPLADAHLVADGIDAGLAAPIDAARRAGRPKGALNTRTAQFRDWILGKAPHPGEALASIYARPVDVLVAELGCTKLEALDRQIRAAAELLPYVESKMPVAIGVSAEGQIQLVLASGAGAGAQVIEGTATLTGLDALAFATVENQGVEP